MTGYLTAYQDLIRSLGAPAFEVTVVGSPAPQGSKKAFVVRSKTGKVRATVRESSDEVAPWRASVAYAARQAVSAGWVPLDGPLLAQMVFSMPRTASLPKTLRRVPASAPDLSKLQRSTEDALDVDASIITNDSRIVDYVATGKVYEGDFLHPWALPHPGAIIRLWPYPEDLLQVRSGR